MKRAVCHKIAIFSIYVSEYTEYKKTKPVWHASCNSKDKFVAITTAVSHEGKEQA